MGAAAEAESEDASGVPEDEERWRSMWLLLSAAACAVEFREARCAKFPLLPSEWTAEGVADDGGGNVELEPKRLWRLHCASLAALSSAEVTVLDC